MTSTSQTGATYIASLYEREFVPIFMLSTKQLTVKEKQNIFSLISSNNLFTLCRTNKQKTQSFLGAPSVVHDGTLNPVDVKNIYICIYIYIFEEKIIFGDQASYKYFIYTAKPLLLCLNYFQYQTQF